MSDAELPELPLGVPLREHLDIFVAASREAEAAWRAAGRNAEANVLDASLTDLENILVFTQRENDFAGGNDATTTAISSLPDGSVEQQIRRGDDVLASIYFDRDGALTVAAALRAAADYDRGGDDGL